MSALGSFPKAGAECRPEEPPAYAACRAGVSGMLDTSSLVFSVPTVCLYINKQADAGPYLERRKLQQLPERLGPERPAAVLQQAVQACIDCAHQPRLVFSLVKQGYRGELVSGKVWGCGRDGKGLSAGIPDWGQWLCPGLLLAGLQVLCELMSRMYLLG